MINKEQEKCCEKWKYCQHDFCKNYDAKQHCQKCWHINNIYKTSRSYCTDIGCPCHSVKQEVKEETGWEEKLKKIEDDLLNNNR